MKSKILNLHFALFLQDIVDRPDIEFSGLNDHMLNAFDAMPQVIPIPRELPPEVPVILLKSSDNALSCNISRSRIDFSLSRTNDSKSNNDLLKDFNLKVSALIKFILERKDISRFGMVAKYFHQDNLATRTLQGKYFTNAVDGAEELSLRYNRQSDQYGFKINDIIEISAVSALTGGKIEKGIHVVRDINNNLKQGTTISYETLNNLSKKNSPKFSESEIEGLIK